MHSIDSSNSSLTYILSTSVKCCATICAASHTHSPLRYPPSSGVSRMRKLESLLLRFQSYPCKDSKNKQTNKKTHKKTTTTTKPTYTHTHKRSKRMPFNLTLQDKLHIFKEFPFYFKLRTLHCKLRTL